MGDYSELLARKHVAVMAAGFDHGPLSDAMFGYQRDVTAFALRQGRAALFLDTGLGKTLCQLEWARQVAEHTGKPVLILAPLAVAAQTVREAARFGIGPARVVREQAAVGDGINIANYEMLQAFDPTAFGGVVLDESSILKSFMGATKRRLTEAFADTPYRLACTATPAPNDHMELLNHAEFLGIIRPNEALSRWFVNDTSTASQSWRLKGHAVDDFWSWVASWARCVGKPSDLGYDDAGFDLPALDLRQHTIQTDLSEQRGDTLFRIPDMSATSMHREKRMTTDERAARVASIVAADPGESWIVWCDTDYEAKALMTRIPGAVEVSGSMPLATKEERLTGFSEGRIRVLVSKPRLAGFGLNWQHCGRMAFAGLSFSYEAYYQAVRRCWRFGQKRAVQVHVVMADTERAIVDAVTRKSADHDEMKAAMYRAMRRASRTHQRVASYNPTIPMEVPAWLRTAA